MKNAVKKTGILFVTVLLAVSISACGGKKADSWPTTGLGAMLPEPSSGKVTIVINDEELFSADVNKVTEDFYESYIEECKERGFTVDSEKDSYSYEAYNKEGYHLRLSSFSKSMDIELKAPIKMETLRWPNSEVAKLIPQPDSKLGKIEWEHEDSFYMYVGDTTLEQFAAYIDKCADAGFTVDYNRGDKYYYAYDSAGHYLSLTHEGFNTMAIRMTTEEEAPAATEATTEAVTEATTESGGAGVGDGEIRPEIKAAIDSYEAFVDEYCAFAESYNSSDVNMFMEYMNLVSKELEMSKEFENLADQELTTAESLYYSEVSLRCSQKLIDAASKMY